MDMNLQDEKRQQQKSPVSFRLPNQIREKAKKLAAEQSSGDVHISESDVYRKIVVSFFSDQCLPNVDSSRESN